MMNKVGFGIFALVLLLGNHLGSTFGIAVAICIFMIVDGLIEMFKKRKPKPKKLVAAKKEA